MRSARAACSLDPQAIQLPSHDAWAHLQQAVVTLGDFQGWMRYGVRGHTVNGTKIDINKVMSDMNPPETQAPTWHIEDALLIRREMKEWAFYAESVEGKQGTRRTGRDKAPRRRPREQPRLCRPSARRPGGTRWAYAAGAEADPEEAYDSGNACAAEGYEEIDDDVEATGAGEWVTTAPEALSRPTTTLPH